MSRNILYVNEIATANNFIKQHSADQKLQDFINEMKIRPYLSHSERWTRCYYFLKENYQSASDSIVTGFAYWLE